MTKTFALVMVVLLISFATGLAINAREASFAPMCTLLDCPSHRCLCDQIDTTLELPASECIENPENDVRCSRHEGTDCKCDESTNLCTQAPTPGQGECCGGLGGTWNGTVWICDPNNGGVIQKCVNIGT